LSVLAAVCPSAGGASAKTNTNKEQIPDQRTPSCIRVLRFLGLGESDIN